MMSYIIICDVKFLISKKINVSVLYLFLMVILFLFSKNTLIPVSEILGINLKIESITMISLFSYLISTLTYVYIFVKILEKDMEYMYSIVFTRISSSKWLISKIISYSIIVSILKLIEYLLLLFFFRIDIHLIFVYFVCEITYCLMIETIVLFVNLFKKKKIIYFILIIASIVIIPKNILSTSDKIIYIWIISIAINVAIFLFSYLRNNTFFSLIGGIYDRNKKYC